MSFNTQWKTLTKEEQATYFREAEKEKILHALQHPGWSFKHNYVRITSWQPHAPLSTLRVNGSKSSRPRWQSAEVTFRFFLQGKRKFRKRKNRKATASVQSKTFSVYLSCYDLIYNNNKKLNFATVPNKSNCVFQNLKRTVWRHQWPQLSHPKAKVLQRFYRICSKIITAHHPTSRQTKNKGCWFSPCYHFKPTRRPSRATKTSALLTLNKSKSKLRSIYKLGH